MSWHILGDQNPSPARAGADRVGRPGGTASLGQPSVDGVGRGRAMPDVLRAFEPRARSLWSSLAGPAAPADRPGVPARRRGDAAALHHRVAGGVTILRRRALPAADERTALSRPPHLIRPMTSRDQISRVERSNKPRRGDQIKPRREIIRPSRRRMNPAIWALGGFPGTPVPTPRDGCGSYARRVNNAVTDNPLDAQGNRPVRSRAAGRGPRSRTRPVPQDMTSPSSSGPAGERPPIGSGKRWRPSTTPRSSRQSGSGRTFGDDKIGGDRRHWSACAGFRHSDALLRRPRRPGGYCTRYGPRPLRVAGRSC